MKSILKTTFLSMFFILTSCAHHNCCKTKTCDSQCKMHKKDNQEQCPMHTYKNDPKVKEEVADTTKK